MFKIYTEISPELEDHWKKLERNANLFPFQKLEWIKNYSKHMKSKDDLFLYYCEFENDTIKVIFPFSIIKIGIFRILCFVGFKFADYCYPVIEKNYELNKINLFNIVEEIRKNYKFDNIIIKNQKEVYFEKNNIFLSYFKNIDKYKEDSSLKIMINNNWIGYLGDKKLKKIKILQRKLENKINKNYQLVINSNDLDIEKKNDIINFLLKNKRDQLNRTKIFHYLNNSKYEKFLRDLFAKGSKDLISISYIQTENKFLAVHLGFFFKENFYYLFPVYDYQFKELSAGRFLLIKMIENCFTNNIKSFDFTTGDELYKKEWSNYEESLYSFIKSYSLKGKIFKKIYLLYKSLSKK